MDETLMAIVTIETADNDEKMRIGTDIHEQLRGNPSYINNDIILNVDEDCKVRLWVDKNCESIPDITLRIQKG